MNTLLRHLPVALALAAFALTGCASSPAASSTSLTAADVAMPSDREPVATAGVAAAEPAAPALAPSGEVVCRATDAFGVVNELSLEWSDGAAAGYLRRTTPSGMVEDLRVRAERYRDLVIADAPNETDLMAHVAVVGSHKGKLHMRVGGTSPAWVPCE